MKVIFLDFDGVINPISFHHGSGFSKTACDNLQSILTKDPAVRIVVSSAWRRNGLEACQKNLKDNGIDYTKLVGLTDMEGGLMPGPEREAQIERWLKDHPEVKQFAVLDDFPLPKFKDRYVKINAYIGITQKDAEIISALLCKG